MRWFSKKVDVRPIYVACMETGSGFRISATDVNVVHTSPFSLFCKYHVDSSKQDPPDPFLQALSTMGIQHEMNVVESDYPDTEQISYDTPEEGFMRSLEYMATGDDAILNVPLFYMPKDMYGYADVLEKRDGESVFGKYHYVVREIKVAKNITESHLLQAAFYTLMLSHIQQRPPEYFCITNGEQTTTQHQYQDYEVQLLESIQQVGRIRSGCVPPAIYGNGVSPWINYCNEMAIQNQDISLISGIGYSRRAGLVDAGFDTIQNIASSTAKEL